MSGETVTLTVRAHFDAAHSIRIPGSICERLHGHRWTVEASFTGPVGAGEIVRDFLEIEREIGERVIARLDHANLDEIFEHPTAEAICRWIWDRLEPIGVTVIRLWETPEFSVTYRRGGERG